MTDAPARGNYVVPKNALFPCSNSQDRSAGALVQRICLQFHAHATQRFEGMLQQQILRFSIDRCSLPLAPHPRPANLYPMMRSINITVTGAANRSTRGLLADRERQRRAALLLAERGVDVSRHFFPCCY